MLTEVLAVFGVAVATVVYGVVLMGVHEQKRANKAKMGLGCASCKAKGNCTAAQLEACNISEAAHEGA